MGWNPKPGKVVYSPAGWRATKPAVERLVVPARAGDALGAGVEADARDLEEDMAGAGVDRDPLAGPRLAEGHQRAGGERAFSRPAAASTKETEPEQS